MRRENKLALIIGFSVLLVVAVLVSDHLSQAQRDEVGDGMALLAELPDESLFVRAPLTDTSRATPPERVAQRRSPEPASPPVEEREAARPLLEEPIAVMSPPTDDSARGVLDLVPLPVTENEAPLVLHNGPAAAGETSGGILDFPRQTVRALLELAERRPSDPEPAGASAGKQAEPAGLYVVQKGDTLYEICERIYGDGEKWRELAEFNQGRVGDDGQVYVGVTLKLLPGIRRGVASHPEPARRASTPAKAATRVYTVQKGDTLSQIAQREVGSVRFLDEIRDLNPSLRENKDSIFVGQKLTLPARNGR